MHRQGLSKSKNEKRSEQVYTARRPQIVFMSRSCDTAHITKNFKTPSTEVSIRRFNLFAYLSGLSFGGWRFLVMHFWYLFLNALLRKVLPGACYCLSPRV